MTSVNPFGNIASGTAAPAASAPNPDANNPFFDAVAKATTSQGGIKMNPNHRYALKVRRCVFGPSGRKTGIMKFVVEAEVLWSDDEARPVGTVLAYTDSTDKQGWEGRVLAFFCAVNGLDPNDAAKVEQARPHLAQVMKDACGEANSHAGKIVLATTGEQKLGKESQKPYFATNWAVYTAPAA